MKYMKTVLRIIDRKILNSYLINLRYITLLKRQRKNFDKNFSTIVQINYKSKENLLAELFDKYGSDKGSNKPFNPNQPWAPHNYSDLYFDWFFDKRNTIKSVLEIGIGSNNPNIKGSFIPEGIPGASLREWKEFCPNATIYGADIDSDSLVNEPRIISAVMDQTKKNSIENYFKDFNEIEFDIIIDDGLHEFSAGLTTFKNIFPYLKKDSIYIIEDVVLDDLISYREFFEDSKDTVKFISLQRDSRGLASIHHNSLVTIQKRNMWV